MNLPSVPFWIRSQAQGRLVTVDGTFARQSCKPTLFISNARKKARLSEVATPCGLGAELLRLPIMYKEQRVARLS